MARKLRIQFEGAIYHVINRGNYRRDLFEAPRTIQAFERCLFETAERFAWRLHAFAPMRNHFHLALETPRTNLPEGMHWLETTFATRFNRFRREHGHLFQGRYKAILVEPGPSLCRVVNYIHLNPVIANIITAEELPGFRWTSVHHFMTQPRPPFLVCADWLRELEIKDNPQGWREYIEYLQRLAADKKEQKRQKFHVMNCGWAIGTYSWRRALAKSYSHLALAQIANAPEIIEFKKLQWSHALDSILNQAGKTRAESAQGRKGEKWKILAADALRQTTTATNTWIAHELHMGAPSSVRQYLSDLRRGILDRPVER